MGFPSSIALRLESPAGVAALELTGLGVADLRQDEDALARYAADYADIYLTHGLRASPCESVWLDQESLAMQAPMFETRAWYRRFGLVVPDWRMRADDHLVFQLQFVAHLMGSVEGAADEAARFLDQHLLRWVDRFAARVSARCATPFYAGLADLTAAYVEELRDLLAEALGMPRPAPEALEQPAGGQANVEASVEVPAPRYVPGTGPSW
jgi:TorA maturation chaperone TorD